MRVRRRRITYVDVFLWAFRIAVVFIVVVGSIATLKAGRYTGRQWADFVEFGLANVFTEGSNSTWFPLRFGVRF